jgi:hypothetical protein
MTTRPKMRRRGDCPSDVAGRETQRAGEEEEEEARASGAGHEVAPVEAVATRGSAPVVVVRAEELSTALALIAKRRRKNVQTPNLLRSWAGSYSTTTE